MTGFNLPPGCSVRDIPGNQPTHCDVCGQLDDACVCPECPTCSANGDPDCYREECDGGHGLRLNKQQIKGRTEDKIEQLEKQINDQRMYLEWLEDKPDDYSIPLPD